MGGGLAQSPSLVVGEVSRTSLVSAAQAGGWRGGGWKRSPGARCGVRGAAHPLDKSRSLRGLIPAAWPCAPWRGGWTWS